MKTAKMLPFLANAAGIELVRVEQLWQESAAYATGITGESDSVRNLATAHEKMIELVEQEVLAGKSPSATPWLMIQAHLSVVPTVVANLIAQVVEAVSPVIERCKAKRESAA